MRANQSVARMRRVFPCNHASASLPCGEQARFDKAKTEKPRPTKWIIAEGAGIKLLANALIITQRAKMILGRM
ncbi:MAG: hypothetical protein Hens3KO_18250 [Henriciella sp.]